MRAVYERGVVAVSASATGWNYYWSGVYNGCSKNAVVNHAVTLIGYGRDESLQKDFWHIQNSWGSSWGEAGRLRLLRQAPSGPDDDSQCGIDNQPEMGIACVNASAP